MKQNEFIFKVLQWSIKRNLLQSTTAKDQCLKLQEELGELSRAVLHNNVQEAKDAIGDMQVVLVQICQKLGFTMEECQAQAYNEIKDRKGKIVNGTFIKNE